MSQKEFIEVRQAPPVKAFYEGLLRTQTKYNIGFVQKKSKKLYSKLCKIKQRSELEGIKNGVYSIESELCAVRWLLEFS